jgi:hypothetical protein
MEDLKARNLACTRKEQPLPHPLVKEKKGTPRVVERRFATNSGKAALVRKETTAHTNTPRQQKQRDLKLGRQHHKRLLALLLFQSSTWKTDISV